MKLASRFKIEDGKYILDTAFHLDDPEGLAVWYIFKMSHLKSQDLSTDEDSQKNKDKQQSILEEFPKNLKEINDFDTRDAAALIMYTLEKGQVEFLAPILERFKGKEADIRFELPRVDLIQKDSKAKELNQLADKRSTNNTLLQVLAYYGKLDLLAQLDLSDDTLQQMKHVKPKAYEPIAKLAKKYKMSNGKCVVDTFDLSCAEGLVFYDIHKGRVDDFKTDLSRVKDLSVTDYEALTLYALSKGQDAILTHLVQELGDKVADMKFVLPTQNHSNPYKKSVGLKPSIENLSTNNSFLQALAAYGKLDLLPKLSISPEAVEKMQAKQPKLNIGNSAQIIRIGRNGR